ncbi:MAG TPA: AI-2E family transporter [Candidatus Acidoferrum sp.]|jgi:predicted PurR-regulated permease PerM|nr:AI-2E family transporter [Candidatus Acidoferrum sp.]
MTQANRNPTTNDRLTTVLSYGILLLLGYLVFRITEPFLVPLAWSAVLAIFFFPAFLFLNTRVSVTTAALLCTLGVTLVLIVPVLLVLMFAGREAVEITVRIRALINNGDVLVPARFADAIRHHLPQSLQDLDFMGPLQQGMEKVASYLAGSMAGLLKNLFSFLVNLFILLFALFFVFRDGESILRVLRHLIPFEKSLQDEMLVESRDLIFASVAVALLIAAIQGVLGGTAFALTHLPAPVFMGVLIAFFSIVPVVGSALIWVPAALWLGLNGSWGKAALVVIICGGVAGLADSLVRPLLLRNRTRLNDLLLFISILGGLQVFGLLGLVAGPTIVAAALGVFRVYMEHRDELDEASA